MKNGIKKKNINFEYIRALSVLAVITIHTVYSALLQFGEGQTIGDRILYRCIMNVMWWAVPCFLMMTGSLLLDINREISMKKLYGKYILRMLVVLFTFGWAFSWLELFFESREISYNQILQALYNVIIGKTWAHMWYIYCLLGLYVLLPLYKLIAEYASDAQMKYILAILFLFESLFRLSKLFGIELGFYCHINTIYPFWLFMGVAWNRGFFRRNLRFNEVLVMISSGLLVFASILVEVFDISLNSLFGYDSVLVVVQAIGLFSMFNSMKIKGKLGRVLSEIGEKSFGIYLIHMFFINLAYKLFQINPFRIDYAMGAVLLIGINLILSFVSVAIMRRMPGIKKIM